MKKILMIMLLAIAGIQQTMAQRTISGTVTRAKDNKELSGVSVMIKGTTLTVLTNFVGKYSINIPPGQVTLIFQAHKMNKKEILIGTSSVVDVKLTLTDAGISEVAIAALGIKRDAKKLPYSVGSFGQPDFEKNTTTNAMDILKGKIAGATISSLEGVADGSTKVIVRGHTSIWGNNNPLYVIDGIPVDNSLRINNSTGHDFGNRANNINPNDIEHLTLLKGAAATTLYGSRGANGVIMINTKQEKTNGLSLEYNGAITTQEVLRLPQTQNTFGYAGSKLGDGHSGSWGPKLDGEIHQWDNSTDNKMENRKYAPVDNNLFNFYDSGKSFSNAVSIGSGDGENSFYASYLNKKTDGVLPTDADSHNKHVFNMNASRTTNRLKMFSTAKFSHINGAQPSNAMGGTNSASSLYTSLLQTPANFAITDFSDYENNTGMINNELNPYYILNHHRLKFYENHIVGGVSLDYKLLNRLYATYRAGIDVSDFECYQQADTAEASVKNSYEQQQSLLDINQDFMLNGNLKFGVFSVSALAGYNTYRRNFKYLDGYNSIDGYRFEKNTNAFMGQADIAYNNYGSLTASARQEYTSIDNEKSNSVFYPALSTAIYVNNITPVLKDYVDLLKIRAAWGKVGNGDIPYPLLKANTNLMPEITSETEIGMDLRMFQNRFSLDMAYYKRISDGQVVDIMIPSDVEFIPQIINSGKIENKGIELMASFKTLQTAILRWVISVNYSNNKNTVLELEGDNTEIVLNSVGNVDFVALEGYPLGVFRTADYLKTDEGKTVVNAENGFPIVSANKVVTGNIQPDYLIGITNSFKYKELEFSFTFDYRAGGSMYSGTADVLYNSGNATQTTYNERQPFIVPNSVKEDVSANAVEGEESSSQYIENDIPISMDNMSAYYNTSQNSMAAKDRLISRNYLKLRSANLVLNVPAHFTKKIKSKGIQLIFTGNNLLLWTPKENNFIDPETSSFGNDLRGEFGEYRAAPSLRSFTAGIRLKF